MAHGQTDDWHQAIITAEPEHSWGELKLKYLLFNNCVYFMTALKYHQVYILFSITFESTKKCIDLGSHEKSYILTFDNNWTIELSKKTKTCTLLQLIKSL